jgi:DNA invertase Pin-like site-specific DNA recombinase
MEGVALAKSDKRYKGRAPAIRVNNGKAELMARLHAEGTSVSAMARQAGVSRQTVYVWLKAKKKDAPDSLQTNELRNIFFS